MAIALVQQAVNGTTGATSVAVTIAAPAAGSLLVGTSINNAAAVTGVSGGGVTWGLAKASAFNNYAADIWYGMNSSGSGTTVTFTFAGSTFGACWVAEFSGVKTSSALDATTDTDTGTGTSATTGGFTASASPVLYVSVLAISGGLTASTLTGSYTAGTVAGTTPPSSGTMKNYSAYRIDTTAGASSTGWTVSSSAQWEMSLAAFLGDVPAAATAPGALPALRSLVALRAPL